MVDQINAEPYEAEPIPDGTPLCWWCKKPAEDKTYWVYVRGNPVSVCPACRQLGELAFHGLGMAARMISRKPQR